MMMTVDEKLHAYAKNQKDRNIDEKKLQQTIIKSKEAYWDGEIERNMSWLEFLYQQASYIQKHWWFAQGDRKSTRLNSSHRHTSRMPSSA